MVRMFQELRAVDAAVDRPRSCRRQPGVVVLLGPSQVHRFPWRSTTNNARVHLRKLSASIIVFVELQELDVAPSALVIALF